MSDTSAAASSPTVSGPPLIEQTRTAERQLKNLESNLAERVRSTGRWTKWWQTLVAVGTALSAGLAGYVSHGDLSGDMRLTIAVVISLTGVLASVGNIWKFEARAEDFRRRLRECKQLQGDVAQKIYQAEGMRRPEDVAALLVPHISYVQSKIAELSDENFVLTPPPSPEAKPAAVAGPMI